MSVWCPRILECQQNTSLQSSHDKQNKVKTFFAPKVLPGHPDVARTLILAEFAQLFANTGHQLLITIAN